MEEFENLATAKIWRVRLDEGGLDRKDQNRRGHLVPRWFREAFTRCCVHALALTGGGNRLLSTPG
jgi:hypothetical protein